MTRQFVLLTTLILGLSNSNAVGDENAYIFSIGSKAPGRVAYEAELLQHLLNVTANRYGAASLQLDDRKLATIRLWNEAHKGKTTHIVTSSNWEALKNTPFDIIKIPIAIQNGLLGYRKCLALESRLEEVNQIKSPQAFRKLVVGQAAGWRDVNRYQDSEIPVVVSPRYENLLPMLLAQRFTCLPLGILEVNDIARKNDGVGIADDLIIFYNLEVFIGVSATLPELAARLKAGLEQIKANGEFDDVFNKHYQSAIDQLNTGERNVFFLRENGATHAKPSLIHLHPIHIIEPASTVKPTN